MPRLSSFAPRATHSAIAENRVVLPAMSDSRAALPNPEPTGLPLLSLGSGWVLAFAGVLVCGTAVLAFLTSSSAAPGVLTILGLLAALGIFLLFGLLAGHIRLSARVEADDLAAALLENIDDGLVITAGDGHVVYANAAAHHLIDTVTGNRGMVGRGLSLDSVFAEDHRANEAYFRTMRAVQRGTVRSEIVTLSSAAPTGAQRVLRLTGKPIVGPVAAAGSFAGGGIFILRDITVERRREEDMRERLEARLAQFQSLPAGVLVADRSGRITFANAQLLQWLGTEWDPRVRELTVGDLVSGDGAELLSGMARATGSRPQSVEVDLIQDNGTIWPATVLIQPCADGGGWTALVLDRTLAQRDCGTASGPLATESFARFFRSAPFGIAVITPDRFVQSSNAAFSRLLFDAAPSQSGDAITVLTRAVNADARASVVEALEAALAGKANIAPVEITIGEDGLYTRRLFFAPLARTSSGAGAAVVYVMDATEQKALEMKFAQSQKMEVVGNLAGGIAHDFNNVMTAIIGFADLLLGTHRPGDPAYQNIKEIRSSADRAADLVHNLLAFSRQQQLQPRVLQLQELVTDVSVMVKRMLGETIELKIQSGRDLWFVKADRGELTRVVMNLAVNARDAMPDGGTLTIRTRNVSERESVRLAKQGMAPGAYVLIEVEDTGVGMAPDVLQKVFEPFFTTKAVGKGTGLGLSTVYGIVKQTGGFVFPESSPGQGTVFRIYLPRHEGDGSDEIATNAQERPPGDVTGTGRVLIVEDEDAVRRFAVEALKRQGYQVTQACDGLEALELLEESDYAVDLIVSDVKMPEMDGLQLLEHVRKVRPQLKFVFVSGYADDDFSSALSNDPNCTFLSKPYTLAKIAARVKDQFRA